MYIIEKTDEFDKWLRKLKDLRAKAKILFRIQKIENDEHFGNCEPVGDGIRELKIDYAKGYRVYFKESDGKIIILLIGGEHYCLLINVKNPISIARNLEPAPPHLIETNP